jgi:hypothetical protein
MLLSVTFIKEDTNIKFTFDNVLTLDCKGGFVGVTATEHFRTLIREDEFDRIEIRKE